MTVNTPKWYQQIEHEQQLRAAGYPERIPGGEESVGTPPTAPPVRVPGGEETPVPPGPPLDLPSPNEPLRTGNSGNARNVGPWQYTFLQPDGSYSPTDSPLHDSTITDTNTNNTSVTPRRS